MSCVHQCRLGTGCFVCPAVVVFCNRCKQLTAASDFDLLRLHSIVVRDFELLRDIWRPRWRLAAFGHSTSQISEVVLNLQNKTYETVYM